MTKADKTPTSKTKKDTVTIKKAVKAEKTASTAQTTENFERLLVEDPHLDVTIAWDKVAPVYHRIVRRVAKTLRLDGFRPGKVPESVAEERINRQYLIQEVMNEVAGDAFQEALSSSGQTVFAEPELRVIKANKDADWTVVAYLPQKPKIELGDYEKLLKSEKKKALAELQKAQEEAAKQAKKAEGDKKDDAAKGDKKAKPVQKDKTADAATLTDEQLNSQATDEALRALVRQLQPAISSVLVRRTAERQLDELGQQLQQYHLTVADYLKNIRMSEAALLRNYMLQSLTNLQLEFVLDALMEARKIKADDKQLLAKLRELLPEVKDEAEQKRQLEEKTVRDYVELMARRQQLADWLLKL